MSIINVVINLALAKIFNIPTDTTIKIIVIEAILVALAADYIYKHYK